MRYCEQCDPPHADALVCTRLLIVRQRATRIAALTTAIAELTALLGRRVLALGTPLVQLRGVGPVTAARLLGELGVSCASTRPRRSPPSPASPRWRWPRAAATATA